MLNSKDLWLGALIGAIVFMWPMVATRKFDRVTQRELIKISKKKYTGINSAYFVHIILTSLIIMPVVLGLPSIIGQDEFFQSHAITMAWLTFPLSGFAISQALFALRKGVYPTSKFYGKSTIYAYTKDDQVQRLGRRQIVVAIAMISFSFLLGLF